MKKQICNTTVICEFDFVHFYNYCICNAVVKNYVYNNNPVIINVLE